MLKSRCLTIVLLTTSQIVFANDFWENWDLGIAAGYGERSNPLLNADDIQTYINIDIAWYGERFFFDNGDIGYNLHFDENLSVNIIGQLNNERDFFGETNAGVVSFGDVFPDGAFAEGADAPLEPTNGEAPSEPSSVEYEVADRNHAYEAGIEAIYEDEWGQLHLSVLNDISGQHHGQRAEVLYSKNYIHQRWLVRPSIGASWKSSALTDYYFGVEADESNAIVDQYTAGASLNTYINILFNYAINKDTFWGLTLGYEKFGAEISDSPIVVEDEVVTAYTGIKYRF